MSPVVASRARRVRSLGAFALIANLFFVARPSWAEDPAPGQPDPRTAPPAPSPAEPQAAPPAPSPTEPRAAPSAPSPPRPIAKIVLALEGRADVSAVWVDGRSIEPTAWSSPIELAPGEHTVRVAGNGTALEKRVTLREGDSLSVYVEPLVAPVAARPEPPPARAAFVQVEGSSGQRMAGYVLGGVGVASLGVCVAFGVRAQGEKSDADALYAAKNREYLTRDEDAARNAAVSTAALGVGIATLALGAIVVFAGRERTVPGPFVASARPSRSPTLSLTVGAPGGGVRGTFW